MILLSLAPTALDAITNSRVRSDRASLLIKRAVPVQPVRPITITINTKLGPKMKTINTNNRKKGRFIKADFRYLADEDVYICPAGEQLPFRMARDENGLMMRRYWTNACQTCAIKDKCTSAKERRITRWEHEHILEEVQHRLDMNPQAMRTRRETVEHPFGTIKARMGATHFLMKRLHNVKTELSLAVLAYNLTRVMNIVGAKPLIAAIREYSALFFAQAALSARHSALRALSTLLPPETRRTSCPS